ncbi:Cell-cycle control medial ring component [Ceratocystis platani]|uniref:Cell-cycle control medial ring component n=1 Tax=Ceratocystis fimbriata f. sp. platani TaxID=88771 RepID=A0A0F8BXM1_CERFI|nr:Cell-cycle control medial ring component [Ceratocystis platani]
MATQVSFAQGFLDRLAVLPITLTADHVEDPRRFPGRPAYTLPKMPTPMSKRTVLAPGAERSINVSLKSARNPPLDISLTAQPLTASVADLRAVVAERTGAALAKIKLLFQKKPVVDSKTLKDLAGEAQTSIELGVMILGGAAALPKDEPVAAADKAASSPENVLKKDEFWAELQVFLMSKLKDEKAAADLLATFKSSYAAKE